PRRCWSTYILASRNRPYMGDNSCTYSISLWTVLTRPARRSWQRPDVLPARSDISFRPDCWQRGTWTFARSACANHSVDCYSSSYWCGVFECGDGDGNYFVRGGAAGEMPLRG